MKRPVGPPGDPPQAAQLLKQIRLLKQQNEKLRAARDLLLPRLMSGEIAG